MAKKDWVKYLRSFDRDNMGVFGSLEQGEGHSVPG